MITTIPRSEFGTLNPESIRTRIYREHAARNEKASVSVSDDAVQVYVVPMDDFVFQTSMARLLRKMKVAAKVRNWKWMVELTESARTLAESAEYRKANPLQ